VNRAWRIFCRSVSIVAACLIHLTSAYPQETPTPAEDERIVTPEEVEDAVRSPVRLPLRIISYPHRAISRGMEKGLIKVEKDHLRERLRLWTDHLREIGVTGLFGGMGEQTGFGGGATYTIGRSGPQKVIFLGRATLAHYQELDARWTASSPKVNFDLAGSYQWRPKENFYGLGHQSLESAYGLCSQAIVGRS
jgi:hypothetical protein